MDPRSVGFWPGNEAGTRRFGSIKYNRIKPLNRAFDDCAPEDDDDALSFVRIGCWRIVFSESSGTQSWRIFEAFLHLRLQNIDRVTNVGNAVRLSEANKCSDAPSDASTLTFISPVI